MAIDFGTFQRDLISKTERDVEAELRSRLGLPSEAYSPTAAELDRLEPFITDVVVEVSMKLAPLLHRAGYEAAVRDLHQSADDGEVAAIMERYVAPKVERRGPGGFDFVD